MTRKARVAVCLYGQYRTGDYCLPWIKEQWASADADYYVNVKVGNTYGNLTSEIDVADHAAEDIRESVTLHLGDHVRSLQIQTEDPLTTLGYWHYAPMFSSMQRAVYSCLRSIAEGSQYDWIVLQRPDVLIGPEVRSLRRLLSHPLDETSIFTIDTDMGQIFGEARSGGIHDMLLAGSPAAMNLLVAGTFEVTAGATLQDWQKFRFIGPNLLLRQCAYQANLRLALFRATVAVVRPTADLTNPVFQSFEYHRKFWTSVHKGMT